MQSNAKRKLRAKKPNVLTVFALVTSAANSLASGFGYRMAGVPGSAIGIGLVIFVACVYLLFFIPYQKASGKIVSFSRQQNEVIITFRDTKTRKTIDYQMPIARWDRGRLSIDQNVVLVTTLLGGREWLLRA